MGVCPIAFKTAEVKLLKKNNLDNTIFEKAKQFYK